MDRADGALCHAQRQVFVDPTVRAFRHELVHHILNGSVGILDLAGGDIRILGIRQVGHLTRGIEALLQRSGKGSGVTAGCAAVNELATQLSHLRGIVMSQVHFAVAQHIVLGEHSVGINGLDALVVAIAPLPRGGGLGNVDTTIHMLVAFVPQIITDQASQHTNEVCALGIIVADADNILVVHGGVDQDILAGIREILGHSVNTGTCLPRQADQHVHALRNAGTHLLLVVGIRFALADDRLNLTVVLRCRLHEAVVGGDAELVVAHGRHDQRDLISLFAGVGVVLCTVVLRAAGHQAACKDQRQEQACQSFHSDSSVIRNYCLRSVPDQHV